MFFSIVAFVGLFALWLLMSGIFKPMLIGFGLISAAFAVFVLRRMEKIDGERLNLSISVPKSILYVAWLLKEIALSSLNVTRIVLQQQPNFRQKLFSIPVSQNTDIALVVYANSITLTPGTVTVETEPGYFLVHALNHSADDYAALADMDERVTGLESVKNSAVTP